MWIPDEDFFSVTVELNIPKRVPVGEWVVLDASRRSGPWREVDDDEELPLGVVAYDAPREQEDHVAASLSWDVEPNHCRFNLPAFETIDFDTKYRKVFFLLPGTYRIRATTAVPALDHSEWYTIEVHD
jgi:hypothetical protein